MPSNPPIFYTTDEVAQILKIPVRLVRKLIREGHLNAVKVAGNTGSHRTTSANSSRRKAENSGSGINSPCSDRE